MNIKICTIAALAFGSVFIIVGILALTIVPLTISKEVIRNEYLGFDENGTYNIMTQRWIEQNYSMKLKVWTVSVTNPDDVVQHGSYPALVEKGPYVYTEYRKRVKVDFMQNNTRVLFRNQRYYIYSENESCASCSLNDQVTIPNILFQYIVNIAANNGPVIKKLVELALYFFKYETPFVRVSVKQMLFEGYEDPLIHSICKNRTAIYLLCVIASIPTRIKFLENDTDNGEYLIDTGVEDAGKIGRVYKWNGRNETPWWSTAQTREINGTNGELFSPSLSASNDLPVFLGDLGRSIYLHYNQSVMHDQIPSYRFVVPSTVYDPFLPENKGFCSRKIPRYFDTDVQPRCLPAGMFDIGRTKSGSPYIYLSGVHFYQSPPQVYQNFTGFQRPRSSDATYIDIEPYTGVVVNAFAASQINVGIISGDLPMFNKMPNMIVPVLWMNEVINVDESTKKDLQSVLVMSRGTKVDDETNLIEDDTRSE